MTARNTVTIQGVHTNSRGDAIQDCPDESADTFLILVDDVELMRASSRAIAENWVKANPNLVAQ